MKDLSCLRFAFQLNLRLALLTWVKKNRIKFMIFSTTFLHLLRMTLFLHFPYQALYFVFFLTSFVVYRVLNMI